MTLVDSAKILIRAGRGGQGCRSFYRDKYYRHPHPDGGDGGKGGDVIIAADPHSFTLLDFKFNQHFRAQDGGHGSGKRKQGKTGEDLIIKVPLGTLVRDNVAGLRLRDLSNPTDKVIAAKGGMGGKGNAHSKEITLPEPGEEKELLLELKFLAEVGIVGFPNTGKSTLLTRISSARPKIASYPFTTKEPVLGVVKVGEFSFTVADLPGLIAGAHAGKGLGDRFLKHIERTRLIIHLVDISASESRDPVKDFFAINKELKLYSEELAKKPQVIVANKLDLPQAQTNLTRFKQKIRKRVFGISALNGEGVETLLEVLREKLCKGNLAAE
ncbi:MAG: GTPase ObgE [Candidatus Omnitrophota bacterium]